MIMKIKKYDWKYLVILPVIFFLNTNYYFFAILGGSLKNTDANSTAKVPISKKVYTSVSMFFPNRYYYIMSVILIDILYYTTPCFLVLLSPSFWKAPNSTCSVTSAPIPLNTSLNRVLEPCHK